MLGMVWIFLSGSIRLTDLCIPKNIAAHNMPKRINKTRTFFTGTLSLPRMAHDAGLVLYRFTLR